MSGIQTFEPRTFEQRFGTHCPFCGAPWGSQARCDPQPSEHQWRQTNRSLFARPQYADRSCIICLSTFQPRTSNSLTCSDECWKQKEKRRANERSRRRNIRRRDARTALRVAG